MNFAGVAVIRISFRLIRRVIDFLRPWLLAISCTLDRLLSLIGEDSEPFVLEQDNRRRDEG